MYLVHVFELGETVETPVFPVVTPMHRGIQYLRRQEEGVGQNLMKFGPRSC